MKKLFTSESVTEGHPDKICDQISDSILDACLKQDPESRVAIETSVKTGFAIVYGELTTNAYVPIPKIARQVLLDIGYTKSSYGIDGNTCGVLVAVEEQSQEISKGVTADNSSEKEQGAGDQGMMFGFACKETPEYMPLPITLAHKITKKLAEVRKNKEIDYLGPDGKSQVTVEYEDGQIKRVHTVVVSTQHDEGIQNDQIQLDVINEVIKPVCGDLIDGEVIYHINPSGSFVQGGPYADSGLTGRKIIVDTYGGYARHGGGAFSGKDPSKVDRSGAYATRFIAKNLVANEICEKCEVALAYAIGVAEPVGIYIESFGTSKYDDDELVQIIRKNFPIKPAQIIEYFDLKRPIFRQTAAYGHFGREEFPWEKIIEIK
jgi:S-adenosylmethionine synthetase